MAEMHAEKIPWSQPDWVGTTHAWILEQLAHKDYVVTGAVEHIKSSLWSYVARVATNKGMRCSLSPSLHHHAACRPRV
ncbi:hypothetical protein KDW_56340 [Dictyobacter vulcani]|uniref:Uncharacterized protein n=1 Tax=Dictyobacter vulcani TaxID=2607529 RepID=A0A5J4KWF0_9CHLR|nr:hypothetical protein [Dictyobacter vulcani]GER91472.1 hypothetical protein KDW_56340 [Dictyobacter vulcani]